MSKTAGSRGGRDDLGRLHSYVKIYNLGKSEIEDLFLDPVTVQEKLDGSQISFMRIGTRLMIRTKGELIYDTNQDGNVAMSASGMFQLAVDSVLSEWERLRNGWVYRGEFLSKPKHNSLAYDRVPKGYIALFDIEVGDQRYLRYDGMYEEAQLLGFDVVPLIGPNTGWDMELMGIMLKTPSILGGQTVEGLVFKNYERFGRDGKVLMGKFVGEAFKETNKKNFKIGNPGQNDVIERIGNSLRTDARFTKAVQHLREKGILTDSTQDIGPLLSELKSDIMEEEREDIVRALLTWAAPRFLRIATTGFPEWYKEQLAAKQFGEVQDEQGDEAGQAGAEVQEEG